MLLDSSRMMNQCAEDPVDCPLCMELLEVDDISFYPCTCGYQICRFCWHRIRTDENGLCPACRKPYPEDPANFKPLSKEDFVRIKAEKRQKNQQKKQKITENRKSLGNVRVVQKNLVFVLGLPTRLADAEVLKRHEYFGKFGKILKVVVNQSTAYAGNQGPCASAYVTYSRSEDALRAIQAVNNISVEGRIIKTSLGTTKYCSHFMKNQSCPKTDCMYLHEMGDPEASFTKEEMQQGKHQEFEKKLHDQLISSTQQMPLNPASQAKFCSSFFPRKPSPSPPSVQFNQYSSSDSPPPLQTSSSRPSSSNERTSSPTMLDLCDSSNSQQSTNISMTAKEEWPSLRAFSPTNYNFTDSIQDAKEEDSDNLSDQSDAAEDNVSETYTEEKSNELHSEKRNSQSNDRERTTELDTTIFSDTSDSSETNETHTLQMLQKHCNPEIAHYARHIGNSKEVLQLQTLDEQKQQELSTSPPSVSSSIFESVDTGNNSFFSSNNFQCNSNGSTTTAPQNEWLLNGESHMPDVLPPVQSNEDWQAAFGFATGHNGELNEDPVYGSDDDLGFDPFKETQKALAELIENEKQTSSCGYYHHNHHPLSSGIRNTQNLHNSNNHQHSNHNHHHHHHHHNHNHHQHNNNRDSNNYLNNNNNNNYQKRSFITTMQQNNRLANCTKLLDELRLGSVIPPRTHVPPPGFSNSPNHMNAFGLGIPRTGNKILPFTQQTLTAFQQQNTPTSWDWSSIDPAIVTTGQHCDLYASQPPPGFTLTPTIDSKYMFNNFI